MKTHSILGAAALLTISVSSCISTNEDDKPTTTTVTEETVVPDSILNPGLTQTTKTTTRATRS